MKTIKLAPGERLVTNQLNRKGVLPQNIIDAARDIVANVRANGDAAVRDYCQRFDGVELQSFRLPQEQIDAALEGLDPAFVAALEKAARQIREFHQREVEQSWFTTRADGTMLGVKVTPLAAAGIYVPGGRAQYPSTVLMNAIPAKVAGVKRVVMVTPPQKDGLISPYTLAAAKLGGVDEIYMVGGAQAVAAMAFGTATIPRVGKIFGPGNAYVTEAKRQVSSRPDGAAIDMPAGPSEVLEIADEGADPAFVAADLLSQAEHGPDSQVVLVTPSRKLAEAVAGEVASQLAALPRREIATKALSASRLILVKDLEACVEVSNRYAPEHLIIQTRNARDLVPLVQNAGSVFVGDWSPESGGDYATGTNHVLPTYGYAATYSSLGLADFTKRMTVQEMTPQGFEKLGPAIALLAHAEELDAHMNAVLVRMDRIKQSKE